MHCHDTERYICTLNHCENTTHSCSQKDAIYGWNGDVWGIYHLYNQHRLAKHIIYNSQLQNS
jgi:hypothetical protein